MVEQGSMTPQIECIHTLFPCAKHVDQAAQMIEYLIPLLNSTFVSSYI